MARAKKPPPDDSDPAVIMRYLWPLGYGCYADYLASPHWQEVRRRYRDSNRPQRCKCGRKGTQLHHLTYARLGKERLTDLLLLCVRCHAAVHGKSRFTPKLRKLPPKAAGKAAPLLAPLPPERHLRPLSGSVDIPTAPRPRRPKARKWRQPLPPAREFKPWDTHSISTARGRERGQAR